LLQVEDSPTDALNVLRRLASNAGLAVVTRAAPFYLQAYGLDNRLTRAVLADGRAVLLRQSRILLGSPRKRVEFLRRNGIPIPQLYAADDAGNSLWEFVPGRPLADLVDQGAADDSVWRRTGAAMAAVHAVEFPAPLQGPIGLDSLELRPLDPVDQLQTDIASGRCWAEQHRPHLVDVLDTVAVHIAAHAERIRAERPAVTHGDVNLLNIIAGEDSVRLIDWDSPVVRYPLAELSALDEHAYLHGCDGLPAAFFSGYNREVPGDLLLAYRIVGCIGWLSGDDWSEWRSDSSLPIAARHRLNQWHALLLTWADQTPDLMDKLS
jgi:tRNA A-37 threonylcarbamoyl transferase component Bud32